MNSDYHQHTGGKQQRKARYQKLNKPNDILGGIEEEKEGPKGLEESGSQNFHMDLDQLSESGSSLYECDLQLATIENPHVTDQIVKLTDNFRLAYKDIKDSQMLREPPLNALAIDKIRTLIKNGRR